jgi:hypothetical protein
MPLPQKRCPFFGVVFRGKEWLEGLLKGSAEWNGLDATRKITQAVKGSSHYGQIRVVMLMGLCFAGFNVVDVAQLAENLQRPVMVFWEKAPDLGKLKRQLESLPFGEKRVSMVEKAGNPTPLKLEGGKTFWIQSFGLSVEEAGRVVKATCKPGFIPEPLRIARMVGSAFTSLKS